jgi:hypothetical protein
VYVQVYVQETKITQGIQNFYIHKNQIILSIYIYIYNSFYFTSTYLHTYNNIKKKHNVTPNKIYTTQHTQKQKMIIIIITTHLLLL